MSFPTSPFDRGNLDVPRGTAGGAAHAATIAPGSPPMFVPPLHALQIGNTADEASGGAERYYFNLMRALPAHGITSTGLVLGDDPALAQEKHVRPFCAEDAPFVKRCSGLRRSVKAALPDCDLVVSHFAPYALPILDMLGRRPLVVHFHGAWALEGAFEGGSTISVGIKRAIERVAYARGSRFIVLSQASRAILEREYAVAPEKIRLVPGGVDIRRFYDSRSRREVRADLGWPADRPIVVTARRLVRSKGIENLIAAIDIVRRDVSDVLLMIAGTGPLEADLQRQVGKLGLESSVRFLGQVGDDLPAVYRAADLSIVPSVALEGFGLVVIEALACGTPTLVTPVTGLPEVVNELEPALVLASAEAADIARGLADALRGRTPLPTSERCLAHASRFDWSAIAGRIATVYREVA